MQVIKRNLKATQDKHKSYADQHREFKEFQVGEHVYLHFMPKRISLRIGSCAKLVLVIMGLLKSLRGFDQWHIDFHYRQQ